MDYSKKGMTGTESMCVTSVTWLIHKKTHLKIRWELTKILAFPVLFKECLNENCSGLTEMIPLLKGATAKEKVFSSNG